MDIPPWQTKAPRRRGGALQKQAGGLTNNGGGSPPTGSQVHLVVGYYHQTLEFMGPLISYSSDFFDFRSLPSPETLVPRVSRFVSIPASRRVTRTAFPSARLHGKLRVRLLLQGGGWWFRLDPPPRKGGGLSRNGIRRGDQSTHFQGTSTTRHNTIEKLGGTTSCTDRPGGSLGFK